MGYGFHDQHSCKGFTKASPYLKSRHGFRLTGSRVCRQEMIRLNKITGGKPDTVNGEQWYIDTVCMDMATCKSGVKRWPPAVQAARRYEGFYLYNDALVLYRGTRYACSIDLLHPALFLAEEAEQTGPWPAVGIFPPRLF